MIVLTCVPARYSAVGDAVVRRMEPGERGVTPGDVTGAEAEAGDAA